MIVDVLTSAPFLVAPLIALAVVGVNEFLRWWFR